MNPESTSLSDLHDIVEPVAVSLWPFAPGLWLVIALATIWIATAIALWAIHYHRNAYRRAALIELRELAPRIGEVESRQAGLVELCTLLKRVALVAYPRNQVAKLSGQAWTNFLNTSMHSRAFTKRPGCLLGDVAYVPAELSDEDAKRLLKLSEQWIRRHRGA